MRLNSPPHTHTILFSQARQSFYKVSPANRSSAQPTYIQQKEQQQKPFFMHRRFSRRHSKTNSTSATQGVNVDGDIAQCSRRQSWSGVFTQWRDKTTRHTRKVLPNVSSPTSPQTSLTSMATTLPTSNSSNLSITPVPTSEHDTYMMQHQRQHDLGARHHHVKVL